MVAESRSDEAFFALCLLTVTGAALLTEKLGFSDTLGAFVAGVLLSETSYRCEWLLLLVMSAMNEPSHTMHAH